MFNFIKTAIGQQSYLGIDIGTTSIKAVEIVDKNMRPNLQNYGFLETYGHLERLNNAIQTSGLKIVEKDTAELLKILIQKSHFRAKDVVASLPSFAVFITLLELPKMSNVEVAQAMQYQARQYVPLPVSEVSLDWTMVGERQDSEGFVKQQVLLISVPNEIIEKYKKIFKMAGLNLDAIEVESLSLIRALRTQNSKPTIVVDFGSRSTNVCVMSDGGLKYNYQSDFGGASLTQALASGLGVGMKRAEKLKKEKGISNSEQDGLSTLMTPYIDAILNEVRRAKTNYEKSFGAKIENIIISGGGAKLAGIDKYVESQFDIPTSIGNPFEKVEYPQALDPLVRELGPSFSVAIGLGIKEFAANT